MAPLKHQILFIGGGETFESESAYMEFLKQKKYDPYARRADWRKWVIDGLSDNFESFVIEMPCRQNASYPAWKVSFEKIIPYLNEEKTIIVGHSLGGIFISKYLSENTFPKHLVQLHLIAPVLDNDGLVGESIGNFAFDTKSLPNLALQADEVHIWSSVDDPIVPYNHAERYHTGIKDSKLHIFENR